MNYKQYNMDYNIINMFAKYHDDFKDLSDLTLDGAIEASINILSRTGNDYIYHLIQQHDKCFIIKQSLKNGSVIYYKIQVSLDLFNAFANRFPNDIIKTSEETSKTKEYRCTVLVNKLSKLSRKSYLDDILSEL